MRRSPPPSWSTSREALRIVVYPPYLRNTLLVAMVVGTILFIINQLDVVLRGDTTAIVWAKILITYFVPFGVCNYGVLVSTRRRVETDYVPRGPAPDSPHASQLSQYGRHPAEQGSLDENTPRYLQE